MSTRFDHSLSKLKENNLKKQNTSTVQELLSKSEASAVSSIFPPGAQHEYKVATLGLNALDPAARAEVVSCLQQDLGNQYIRRVIGKAQVTSEKQVQRKSANPPAGERKTLPGSPSSGPNEFQKSYYFLFLLPIWKEQLNQFLDAQRQYRYHLLAMECLRIAKGPGGDPVRLAEFCRLWKIPLTLPIIGPTGLLRKIGKGVGGWPSPSAVFDPTGALNIGVRVIGELGPLLGQMQMKNALLVVFDEKVIDSADQGAVGTILEECRTPKMLMNRLNESKNNLEKVWNETVTLTKKLEQIRQELGLPETTP